jgi:hypothetical protein
MQRRKNGPDCLSAASFRAVQLVPTVPQAGKRILRALDAVACVKSQSHEAQNVTLPPKIPIPEPMFEILKDVINKSPDSYFPSESKIADIDIHTPEEAYRQLTILYPEKTKMVECWIELNNYFRVFSNLVGEMCAC